MEIDRKENESDLSYHKRLIYGKLVDKTLSDCDYSEIAEKLYGKEYASDVARRMMYGSRKTLELLESESINNISDKKLISEIEMQKIELEKERKRFYDQRREYSKILSEDSRREYLSDVMCNAAKSLGETIGSVYKDPITYYEPTDNEAVLVFSDWHYGMVTSNIFNKYDTDICIQRVKEVVDRAIEKIITNRCRVVNIVGLGDFIHGDIHVSARVASNELACDQIMQVSEVLAQSIIRISEVVPTVCVYMTYGNHARSVQNKSDSIHRDNMERIIPWWIEQRVKDYDNIYIMNESKNEFIVMDVCGHKICATHGDLDYVGSASRVIGGLLRMNGTNVEYIILGDKHHRESYEELGVTSTICGSLCGTDDYANEKRMFSSPSQLLLIVNKERGVEDEYRIRTN